MYPLEIIKPMKEELTSIGFKDLTKSEDVNNYILNSKSAVLIVNSVCGCAAAKCKTWCNPAISNPKVPDELLTVFAGVDKEATEVSKKPNGSFSTIIPMHCSF